MQSNFQARQHHMTYWVQNFAHDIQEVGKHFKSTKKIYTWKFDARMGSDSYVKDNCLGKKWRCFEVTMIDSVVSRKKTVRVNGMDLLVDEYCPHFCRGSPFMIQEYDVGIPLQIVKDRNTEVVDLKIVDKTFSNLESQSNKNSKILAIHTYAEDNGLSWKGQKSLQLRLEQYLEARTQASSQGQPNEAEKDHNLLALGFRRSEDIVANRESRSSNSSLNETRLEEHFDSLDFDFGPDKNEEHGFLRSKEGDSANSVKQFKSQQYSLQQIERLIPENSLNKFRSQAAAQADAQTIHPKQNESQVRGNTQSDSQSQEGPKQGSIHGSERRETRTDSQRNPQDELSAQGDSDNSEDGLLDESDFDFNKICEPKVSENAALLSKLTNGLQLMSIRHF